jgi:predicted phage terminase large subunit-like protein
VTLTDTDWREHFARRYEPRPRRWATPGQLARALDPATLDSKPLQVIDRELVRLTDHQVPADALAVFCPPQEGKSQRVSRRYPEWLLAHNPALRVAVISYESEIAVRWGRQIKRDIAHADRRILDLHIQPDSAAAGRWDTPEDGGVYCTGIGGALTGRPVDVLVIDDPVKGREEAESETLRERAWDWWENVALPRLAPGGVCVLMMTRWHEDDLAGRILARPSPLRWRVLSMPAIAGHGDPLGRPPGVEFPSVRGRDPGYFHRLQANLTPYVFASIYQQNPTSVVGNFFRRPSFRYWRRVDGRDPGRALAAGALAGAWLDCEGRRVDLADPGTWRFATVDVAASTSTESDWTVVAVWAITREGDLVLLDRRRAHVEMADHFAMAAPLRAKWRFDVLFVEKQFYSKTLVLDATAAGIPVAKLEADKDKVTRAIPAASRLHAGRVWFPAVTEGCPCGQCKDGAWLEEWENEVASFPKAAHDDQVDTLSYAARVAAAHWVPPLPPGRPNAPQPADLARIAAAHTAATGNGHEHLDLMNMPLG